MIIRTRRVHEFQEDGTRVTYEKEFSGDELIKLLESENSGYIEIINMKDQEVRRSHTEAAELRSHFTYLESEKKRLYDNNVEHLVRTAELEREAAELRERVESLEGALKSISSAEAGRVLNTRTMRDDDYCGCCLDMQGLADAALSQAKLDNQEEEK